MYCMSAYTHGNFPFFTIPWCGLLSLYPAPRRSWLSASCPASLALSSTVHFSAASIYSVGILNDISMLPAISFYFLLLSVKTEILHLWMYYPFAYWHNRYTESSWYRGKTLDSDLHNFELMVLLLNTIVTWKFYLTSWNLFL